MRILLVIILILSFVLIFHTIEALEQIQQETDAANAKRLEQLEKTLRDANRAADIIIEQNGIVK